MRKINTILVEDEDDIRFVLDLALRQNPAFDLVSFTNGIDALRTLEDSEHHVDLALVNLNLPAMSGLTFAQRMLKIPACANASIIFVTAALYGRDTDKLKGDKVIGVISKPFDALSLADQIKAMLEHRQPSGRD